MYLETKFEINYISVQIFEGKFKVNNIFKRT